MSGWFGSLDRLLRGEATRLPDLVRGEFDVPVVRVCATTAALAVFYGACMGSSALIAHWGTPRAFEGCEQMLAGMAKVPMLFFLTLLVTFPSLYVFNALVGSKLSIAAVLRLLVAALAVMIAVLASFGTISAFFALSTSSHPFMIVLQTCVFTVAGFLGMAFLLRTLQRLTLADTLKARQADRDAGLPDSPSAFSSPPAGLPIATEAPVDAVSGVRASGTPLPAVPLASSLPPLPPLSVEPIAARSGPLERIHGHTPTRQVWIIFRIWTVVFALVGVQMAWILRPFIGDPAQPFIFFSPRESNFFAGLFQAIRKLFEVGGGPVR
jgi:hypothetical protein